MTNPDIKVKIIPQLKDNYSYEPIKIKSSKKGFIKKSVLVR